MSEPVFTVTYRVGFDHLNAFFGAWWKRTRFDRISWRRFLLYSLGTLALLLLGMYRTISGSHFWPAGGLGIDAAFGAFAVIFLGLACGFFGFVLVFIVGPIMTYIAQLLVFALGPMRKRTSHVRATAAGIDKTTGDRESQTPWRDFTAVIETKKTVLLFTNRNCAAIVPKSAFATPVEAEAFAAFAKAQWTDAQSVF